MVGKERRVASFLRTSGLPPFCVGAARHGVWAAPPVLLYGELMRELGCRWGVSDGTREGDTRP